MGNSRQAIDVLIDEILKRVDKRIEKLGDKFDKSFSSVVYGKNSDGTYNIAYMGNQYAVKNGLGTELSLGQGVWVMIPNGKLREMFIYAIK